MSNIIARTIVLSLCLTLVVIAAEARAGAPTEAIKNTVNEVVRLLNDPALKGQKRVLSQRVKRVVDRRFDYEEMAKRSLGETWGRLSDSQRREFVRLFAELLEASYADKFEKFSDEKVKYVGESLDGQYAEVRTLLMRRNDRIPMNYRLINKSGWKVYDVVIEGVSLVSTYRSQFRRVLNKSSYSELVKRLRTRVDELHRMGGV